MNALAEPGDNALSDPPLGSGLAKGVADLKKLYPAWQQQFIEGQTQLQFQEWLKAQGIKNPVMPR